MGILDLAGLQRRHRADCVLRLVLDQGTDTLLVGLIQLGGERRH
jgi:hypothetical protein